MASYTLFKIGDLVRFRQDPASQKNLQGILSDQMKPFISKPLKVLAVGDGVLICPRCQNSIGHPQLLTLASLESGSELPSLASGIWFEMA